MKIKKILSIILTVFLLISTISISFAETSDIVSENYNLHKDLYYSYTQPVGDKEISNLTNTLKNFTSNTEATYIDNNGVKYIISGSKGVFTIKSIMLPENTKTYTLPSSVTFYYFVASEDAMMLGSYVSDVEKNKYSWNMPIGVILCSQTFSIKSIDAKILNNLYCEKLILSNNIGSLPDKAFASNTILKEIYAPQVMTIGSNAFSYCMNLKNIYAPKVVYIKDQAFISCSSLASYDFSSVQSIGKNAFKDCSSLKSVIFSKDLTYLYEGAFSGCTNLVEIQMPAGIKINTIPKNCFMNCSNLKDIALPYEIIIISESAFNGCANLTVVNLIESNISTIGQKAFFGCLRLETVYLPQSLVTIYTNSFESCPNLRLMYFDSELTDTQINSFNKAGFGDIIVTQRDTQAPIINILDGANLTIAPDKITSSPVTLTITDKLDVTNVTVTCNGKNVYVTSRILKTNTYSTVVWDVKLSEDGEYKIKAEDAVGNITNKTIKYTNTELLITSEDISVDLNEYYNELPVFPPVTVAKNNTTLVKDKHYTVEYKNTDIVGKAQIIVAAIAPYKGNVVIDFEIKKISTIPGDMNGDKEITASDARLILRMSAMLEKYTEEMALIADVTGDGSLTAADARKVLRIAAMLE